MIIRTIFILCSLFFSSTHLSAQQALTGKWTSYSITAGDQEKKISVKTDHIIIVFGNDQRYTRYGYAYGGDSTLHLTYHMMNDKLEVSDQNGRILKLKKFKEKGTYQVGEDEILFVTDKKKYSKQYQLQNGILTLKYDIDGEDHGMQFRRK